MKSKHKLTDKIRVLADRPQKKKTVGRNENNNIKNINGKKICPKKHAISILSFKNGEHY